MYVSYCGLLYVTHIFLDYNTRTHEAGVSLDGLRDQALHTVRRRPWARGMSSASMKYYEGLVHTVVEDFVDSLSQRAARGEVIDFTEWANFFGYVLASIHLNLAERLSPGSTSWATWRTILSFWRAAQVLITCQQVHA